MFMKGLGCLTIHTLYMTLQLALISARNSIAKSMVDLIVSTSNIDGSPRNVTYPGTLFLSLCRVCVLGCLKFSLLICQWLIGVVTLHVFHGENEFKSRLWGKGIQDFKEKACTIFTLKSYSVPYQACDCTYQVFMNLLVIGCFLKKIFLKYF